MTTKEKANNIINTFKKATSYKYQEYAGANYSTFEHDIDVLKDCALIMVDELIKSTIDTELLEYWLDVKKEINLMK